MVKFIWQVCLCCQVKWWEKGVIMCKFFCLQILTNVVHTQLVVVIEINNLQCILYTLVSVYNENQIINFTNTFFETSKEPSVCRFILPVSNSKCNWKNLTITIKSRDNIQIIMIFVFQRCFINRNNWPYEGGKSFYTLLMP